MKKYTISLFVLFLLFSFSNTFSQNVVAGLKSGFGFYQMEELRSLNNRIIRSTRLDVQNVDDYPAFLFYQPHFSIYWERIELGVSWSFNSTGSRYSLKDYSGEYRYDTRIKSFGPALMLNLRLYQARKLGIFIYNTVGLLDSKLELEEYLKLFETVMFEESIKFESKDVIWEPGIKVEYPYSLFLIEASLGYSIQFDGKGLTLDSQTGETYPRYLGNNVHAGWNGFKLGLCITFIFPKENNIE